MKDNSLTLRLHGMKLCGLRRKHTRRTQYRQKWPWLCPWLWLCPQLPTLRTIKLNYIYISKRLEKDDLNLARWKKNHVPSAIWGIHESSQNPVTMYKNYNFRGFTKTMFPYALRCFHVFSQTPITTPKLSKIGCFPGINPQLSKQSQQVNTFSLSTSQNEYRTSQKHISDHHFLFHSLDTVLSDAFRHDYL